VTTKVIVAVHGIGDQVEFQTIKSVAYRFFDFRSEPFGSPLGSFHSKLLADVTAPTLEVTADTQPGIRLAFTEAYWALVPRGMVKEGYTLETSKCWAQTIVERFRIHYEKHLREGGDDRSTLEKMVLPPLQKEDYSKLKRILLEMIETLGVLERLTSLAEKAGLFKFSLKKLLDDFVGDVQVVADFQEPRSKILARFLTVMRSIYLADPGAEIYVVAHSEGTVVSFLGLLTAMCNGGPDAGWVRRVRGYMTIGSPIDKHLILWPDLFSPFALPDDKATRASSKSTRVVMDQPIQWKNYYDYGDPVGFNLRTMRDWLDKHEWKSAFKFDKSDDHGFGRYWLPGKAHNDYWQDKQVFGHFIKNVVGLEPKARPGQIATDFSEPPGGRLWAVAASYAVPYFITAVITFAAVFLLRKGVIGYTSPEGDSAPPLAVFESVGLSTLVLGGLTAMAGIFRVTREPRWRLFGFALFALLTIPYWLLHWSGSLAQRHIGGFLESSLGSNPLIAPALMVVVATLLVEVANLINRKHPALGMRPFLVLVGGPIAGVVVAIAAGQDGHGPLWSLLLASAGALYLWWLSALLFDLVFVWHHYVRHQAAIDKLRTTVEEELPAAQSEEGGVRAAHA
jgi:hypothetical protein